MVRHREEETVMIQKISPRHWVSLIKTIFQYIKPNNQLIYQEESLKKEDLTALYDPESLKRKIMQKLIV
tara:strand:+ start:74 stop:280 length:207 start_codon:yes stop_codon:yes gene_type:complete